MHSTGSHNSAFRLRKVPILATLAAILLMAVGAWLFPKAWNHFNPYSAVGVWYQTILAIENDLEAVEEITGTFDVVATYSEHLPEGLWGTVLPSRSFLRLNDDAFGPTEFSFSSDQEFSIRHHLDPEFDRRGTFSAERTTVDQLTDTFSALGFKVGNVGRGEIIRLVLDYEPLSNHEIGPSGDNMTAEIFVVFSDEHDVTFYAIYYSGTIFPEKYLMQRR